MCHPQSSRVSLVVLFVLCLPSGHSQTKPDVATKDPRLSEDKKLMSKQLSELRDEV